VNVIVRGFYSFLYYFYLQVVRRKRQQQLAQRKTRGFRPRVFRVNTYAFCVQQDYLEAARNIEIIIEQWLETARMLGRDIPQPKGKLLHV